jgi:hypothetical protein
VSGVPGRTSRLWSMLWPLEQQPVQFPTAAAGVLAALADGAVVVPPTVISPQVG